MFCLPAMELDEAFAKVGRLKTSALLVIPDPVFLILREHLGALETRYRIPTMHYSREHVLAGGLLSYGANFKAMYHQAGVYVGRILKDEKPRRSARCATDQIRVGDQSQDREVTRHYRVPVAARSRR
jgi:ABC-type uncharacterized transport system substrate-binding protein